MKINLIRTANDKFWPASEEDLELMKKLKIGDYYKADITLDHNYALLQKIHVFFKHCAKHYYGDENVNKDQVELTKDKLKMSAGYVKQVFLPDGKRFELKPTSISYAKMTEEERRDCYQKLVTAACEKVFHDASEEQWNNLMGFF